MCLVLFGIDCHPDFPLVLAANRDEYYARPTLPMAFWEDEPAILAGRDLAAGGTWMGIHRSGRFAALTNYRDLKNLKINSPSRGQIIPSLLLSGTPVPELLSDLNRTANAYNGFNLLAGQGSTLYWYSNRDRQVICLAPGIHGVSNHLMDTPWPKVAQGKAALSQCLASDPEDNDALFALLADTARPKDALLPDTGVGLEWERILSPIFIQSPDYGTRSSTLLRIRKDGRVSVIERTYDPMTGQGTESPAHQDRSFVIDPVL